MSDSLDIERLRGQSWIRSIEYHDSLTSTNDRARAIALEGEPELPILIVAQRQTAGRGRGQNRWWTGDGGLACTLLFDPQEPGIVPRYQAMIPLAAAVAIVDAVAKSLAGRQVGLHWPNDVFVAGRKLAGVLVEGLPDGRQILGIGLNVNNALAEAPPELAETATTLAELTGSVQDRTEVLAALLWHLESALGQLAANPESLGRRADQLCLQHGRPLCLRSGSQDVRGICRGIAPDGALVLETPAGYKYYYSGVLVHDAG
ncbi:MAG: biotin--[acetyl-CoA-carboxylase] ligase [Pirellulales bacterium]